MRISDIVQSTYVPAVTSYGINHKLKNVMQVIIANANKLLSSLVLLV